MAPTSSNSHLRDLVAGRRLAAKNECNKKAKLVTARPLTVGNCRAREPPPRQSPLNLIFIDPQYILQPMPHDHKLVDRELDNP